MFTLRFAILIKVLLTELLFAGVDFATRKIGSLAKPKVTVDVQDSVFYLKSENTFKTFEIKCSLGEEFDEAAVDGRKCKVYTFLSTCFFFKLIAVYLQAKFF